MHRRSFLVSGLGALGVAALPAIEPFQRRGGPRLVLGLAAYSFRDRMKWMRGKPNPVAAGVEPWEIGDFIDFCADHGGVAAELTSYFFPPEITDAGLLEIKRQAYLRGVPIAGTAVGNTFTHPKGAARDSEIAYVKQWIHRAAVLGAPHIRVFAGDVQTGSTREEAERNCIEAYEECLGFAAEKGVFLGLENHHGIVATADSLLRIIRAVNSPWAGINLDSGNFHTEDPYADLEKLAAYAVNVQVKVTLKPAGRPAERMDFQRVARILKDSGYQGWVTLEYEDEADPAAAVPALLDELRGVLA
jgi:sugar phosphate isomerase/epimerase